MAHAIFRTLGLVLLNVAWVGSAIADPAQDYYREALRVADQHVQKQKRREAEGASALSSSLIRELLGRYYQVGDRWEVAAAQRISALSRPIVEPGPQRDSVGAVGVFRYEVVEIASGATPQVVLQVTQLAKHGVRVADPRVQFLRLKMSDALRQGQKTYVLAGSGERVDVIPQGIRSGFTSLEFFPLDVPELSDPDVSESVAAVPELPAELSRVARAAGWTPKPAAGRWYDQSDFFGRPVRFLWERGKLWPTYLETPQGIAILLDREGA